MPTQAHTATSPVLRDTELLRGSFRILFFYDVAEAFDLEKLRQLLGERGEPVENIFPRRTPDYVRFEQAPVTERADSVTLKTQEHAVCSIRYYSFAGVVLQLELPFECDWNTLISETSRWIDPVDIEADARATVRRHLDQMQPAIIKPTQDWLQEEYLVINVKEIGRPSGEPITGAELLSLRGPQLAQLLRGELLPLADKTSEEILQGSISYYQSDLVVIGSAAALVLRPLRRVGRDHSGPGIFKIAAPGIPLLRYSDESGAFACVRHSRTKEEYLVFAVEFATRSATIQHTAVGCDGAHRTCG